MKQYTMPMADMISWSLQDVIATSGMGELRDFHENGVEVDPSDYFA